MKRCILLVACVACAHHHEHVALDDVTTTSAVIREPRPVVTIESPAIDVRVATRPTALPSQQGLDDVGIATTVQRANSAAVQRADLALRYVQDVRVRDFAQLVRDRNRDAKTSLSFLVTSPDVAQPPDALRGLAGQSRIDFDRAYVDMELRAITETLGTLDEITPRATTAELRKRLMDLRPQLADLYTRAYELQQILVTAPFTSPR